MPTAPYARQRGRSPSAGPPRPSVPGLYHVPAAPFAGLAAAADIGVVQLDETLKVIAGVPVGHGLAGLVTPAPGRGVGEARVVLELASQRTGGPRGHQINRPEPVSRRLAGFVEDGVSGHRGLMPAALALILAARGDQTGLVMVAARAAKAVRSLTLDDISQAVGNRLWNCLRGMVVYTFTSVAGELTVHS